MKTLTLLLSFFISLNAIAVAPYGIKGQNQSSTLYSNVHQFPNNQVTNIGGINALVETGNKNILVNPDFEHSTFNNSWTSVTVTPVVETTDRMSGKKSTLMAPSAQTFEYYQDSTLYAASLQGSTQLLAMVWVRTNQSGIKVCSRNDGVTSTTNCVTVAPQSPSVWQLIKVPFISSSTSNGISIAASSSITGNVYIDDAFVGAVDLKTDVSSARLLGTISMTGCASDFATASTASFATLGTNTSCTYTVTGSVLAPSTQVAGFRLSGVLQGDIKVIATGPFAKNDTASNAQVKFIVKDLTNSKDGQENTIFHVSGAGAIASSNSIGGLLNYASSASTSSFEIYGRTTAAGSTAGIDMSSYATPLFFEVWSFPPANQIYSASCGANCVPDFSAQVSAAGVVSGENIDWINGNCAITATSLATCTYNSGINTVAMNCTVSAITDAAVSSKVETSTASAVAIRGNNTSTSGYVANPFSLSCSKTGADFIATRTIVGSFNEVMTTPNVSKPKTCYYAFGGASATLAAPTVCSTGTCVEVYDSCRVITPPTFSSTGLYTNITIANGTFANSSFIDCKCQAFDASTGNVRECVLYWETGDNTWMTSSSGGYVGNIGTASLPGVLTNTWVTVKCEGQAPQ